jgi:hypothetical protein
MALIGNYCVLCKSLGRSIGGTMVSGDRSNWNQTGGMRNWGKQSGLDWSLTAIPKGHGAGGARLLPKTAGGMTSRREAVVSITGSGAGALGMGLQGTAYITLDSSGIGGLIAGGVGTATISITGSGEIIATIGSPGTATISLGAVGNIGALGWIIGESQVKVDGSMESYAKGHMTGTTLESGLTVTGITNAIWNALKTQYAEPGTMGNALSTASSGGVDMTALAEAVRTELAVELERITKLAALSAIDATLTVTPTGREAGEIRQLISTVGETTTVETV